MESPPKRITRARAAVKAAKIVTPAVKAKRTGGTATASTKSTAAKRKTRADENETEDGNQQQQQQQQQQEQQAMSAAGRALRARPRRAADTQEEAAAPAKVARTRLGSSKGTVAGETSSRSRVGGVAEKPAAASARPRGRPKKTPVAEAQQQHPVPEATEKKPEQHQRQQQQQPAPKKTTTTRPRPGVLTTGAGAAKPAVKKTVKFQEPDKENIGPRVKAKESVVTTGLRGRPARRGGATSTKTMTTTATTTRAATRAAAGQKKPLSPKKVTQVPVARDHDDSSEDELAAEKARISKTSPLKPAILSPVKPPTMSSVKQPAATSPLKASATSPLKLPATSPVEPPMEDYDAPVASDEKQADQDETVEEPVPGAGSSLGSTPKRLPSSPFKVSMKSPAKRIGSISMPGSATPARASEIPAFKTPLLQSAAKRPQSPIKGLGLSPMTGGIPPQKTQSAMKSTMFQSPAKRAMPNLKPLTEPRPRGAPLTTDWPETQPLLLTTPVRPSAALPSHKLMEVEVEEEQSTGGDELLGGYPIQALCSPLFSGRLSSVVPRHVDPTLRAEAATAAQDEEDKIQLMPEPDQDEEDKIQLMPEPDQDIESAEGNQQDQSFATEEQSEEPPSEIDGGDPMAIDDMAAQMEDSAELTPPTPTGSCAQQSTTYQLREKDIDPYQDLEWESESEDGLAAPREATVPTPARATDGRRATMGLTSLAEQFGSWTTVSPVKVQKAGSEVDMTASASVVDATDEASCSGSFFEDGLLGIGVEDEQTSQGEGEGEQEEQGDEGDLSLDDIVMTDEDIALAQEANDMSVMELYSEKVDGVQSSFDDGLSEASQEYGDENEMPTERTTTAPSAPMTPARPQTRMMTFHTTSKVPLKPADESTPSPLKQRSMSVSRVMTARRRPSGPSRSATVISYSPTKSSNEADWSAPTPMTPRREANSSLLEGAVVFVDVHTDEGGDASSIFIELLGQMGARCVKTWHWNPAGGDDLTKAGITHVVFKDGSKRTLEKVRAAGGLVRCVGANWILDCERQGQRLDEAPYIVDTSLVPRGGARRRKSMEPKALAKLNDSSVATATTPANRRDSTMWMHVPSPGGEGGDGGDGGNDGDDDDDLHWSQMMLTPVPKTPAPEAVARYVADLPCGEEDDEDYEDGFTSAREVLATRTCPPKRSQYYDMGEGILGHNKDENVLMRLMAARRKSLQFAPKVASPLSRTWEE
ncbi:hypothetical protein CP533_5476 [Ophiocordyceps camponoti-saundersi (nom. inval.)]|nr:hypothetical protein CP533_5476 [Ophiocordyceps camponoti-saundersi (nom. inval.)]